MWLNQNECVVRNPDCCFFCWSVLMWLLWCCGDSTVDYLGEDGQRIVVVLSSSYLVSFSFWSWAFVAYVVCSRVIGWVVVVVVMGLSLLLMKSLSIASQFELSSAVVSQVMSLVRSLLSVGSGWL